MEEMKEGEQDQAPDDRGKIRIDFMIPFELAESSKPITSPYIHVNPTRLSSGSTHTWKSPLIHKRN
jgi:hypothetical protein